MPQALRDLCMAAVVLTLRVQILRKMLRRHLLISCFVMLGGLPSILDSAFGSHSWGHGFDAFTAASGGVCIGLGISGLMRWWHG